MSKMSEDARHANKAKARKLANRETGDVDASGWTEAPAGFLHADKKLGNRPISKQNLACGGRAALKHGGRKSRAMGGPPAGMGTAPSGAMASNAGQPLVASVSEPPQNRFSFSGNMSPLLGAAGMNKGGRAHRKDGGGHWIAGAIKHPGALHKELGVPEGKKIPAKKLKKAEHSSNPVERKRADLAETLKHMHHAKGGEVKHEKGAQNPEVSGTRPAGGRIAKADGGGMLPPRLRAVDPNMTKEGAQRIVAGWKNDMPRLRPKAAAALAPHVADAEKWISAQKAYGGRITRADGGKAGKGKMNVNIIIAQKPEHPPMPMGAAPHPAAPPPMVPPPGAMPPPPGGGAPMPPPGGAPMPPPGGGNMPPPSMQRPPMGRASGGSVYPEMEYSAGGGKGRLEKARKYGL